MKWLLIGFVKFWRAAISPWYGQCCKYYPSCSAYGLEALQLQGALKGSGLAIWRIMRCNPWSKGGVDPVPGSPLEAQVAQWWAQDGAAPSVDDLAACAPADELSDARHSHKTSRVAVPGPTAAAAAIG